MKAFLDGPMGSELTARGVDTSSPLWSAQALVADGTTVAAIHHEYVTLGCTHHRTNTFRTRRSSVGEDWVELTRRAVKLAKLSVSDRHTLLGSLGPVEDCYRPDRSPGEESRASHRELAGLLVAEGVDVLLCEAFPSALEALVAVEECVRTDRETWVAFTAGPDGDLLTPRAMREAARDCIRAGADAVLVNCVSAERTLPYVDALAGLGVLFGAYANAAAWNGTKVGAARYADLAASWVEAGAELVGACCGTGPEYVDAVRRRLL